MKDLVIKTTLPTIEANFEVVKQQLIDGLKTYDVIITSDTVKDGKSMAAEINKIKSAIKDQQKKALEDIMGPVDGFKDKIKELVKLTEEAYDKISAQVKAYEEKTKLEIQKKVKVFLDEELGKAELRSQYYLAVTILDLVKLTSVTKTGNLTSATMNTIKGRIAEQKNLQLEEDAKIAKEKKEKDDEIAKIKEDARIEAEANIQVHVTIDPPEQQTIPEEAIQACNDIDSDMQDSFNMVGSPQDNENYEQQSGYLPTDEQQTAEVINSDGKAEFIAQINILIKAPINMPKDVMAKAVFQTLEAQGVEDIQNIVIL